MSEWVSKWVSEWVSEWVNPSTQPPTEFITRPLGLYFTGLHFITLTWPKDHSNWRSSETATVYAKQTPFSYMPIPKVCLHISDSFCISHAPINVRSNFLKENVFLFYCVEHWINHKIVLLVVRIYTKTFIHCLRWEHKKKDECRKTFTAS
jgi:hypothetical protein